MCYQSETQNMNDGYGSDWHPSAITQQKSAYVLADKICQVLGLSSDQEGIDVAANAKFNTVTSDTAMMSDYFNDWNKSYYVTTVTGGSGKGSIQTVASGIKLKQNGKYMLKLSAEIDKISDIPFFIRNKDTGKIYFEARIGNENNSVILEEELFSEEDAECEIIFMIGGTDNSRFTLNELKLIGIS